MSSLVGASPTSVHVPSFVNSGATAQFHVEFSRNPRSFPINRYVEIIPTTKPQGKYLRIDDEEAVRVTDIDRYRWPDRQKRPAPDDLDHEFVDFSTTRYAPGFRLGKRTVRAADWNIVASHARMAATKAMVLRTQRMLTVLTNSSNWISTITTDTATNMGGGKWNASSTSNKYIQKAVNAVANQVVLNTNGSVHRRDLKMVMGPDVAKAVAESPEIAAWLQNHGATLNILLGRHDDFSDFGILAPLFGIGDVVVEDTPIVTTPKKPGTRGTKAFQLTDSVVFLTRERMVGSTIDVDAGDRAITYSTCAIFAYEDMTVETKEEDWDRFTEGSVVDDTDCELTAPLSGFYMSDVL